MVDTASLALSSFVKPFKGILWKMGMHLPTAIVYCNPVAEMSGKSVVLEQFSFLVGAPCAQRQHNKFY